MIAVAAPIYVVGWTRHIAPCTFGDALSVRQEVVEREAARGGYGRKRDVRL